MPSSTAPRSSITPPRVPLIDQRTGLIDRAWYLFFFNIYSIVGAGTSVVPVASGGTGLTTIPTNGQLLIGNGLGYTLSTLGAGAGVSVVNGAGSISVANTGVLSNIAGTGISVSNATGDVTIANTGVLSFSGGTTGLTPIAAAVGAIVLSGTLGVANGGTNGSAVPTAGAVAYGTGTAYGFTGTGTTGQVLTSAGAGTPTWTTPTTGTVTSVTGTSPVVSSGGTTPAISLAAAYGDTLNPYASKTANYVLAAPNGSAGVPTFRALVAADIPALPYGTGTVTSASVVSANGFAGTVATATTTPAITLTTTVTGLLKGNGTAISAATANTDYQGVAAPVTKTADFTVVNGDVWYINNKSGSTCVVTLPAAASWPGRTLTFKNMQAQLLNSASSNVVPLDSTTAGTSILLNVIGNWATMVSDGTNWVIMQAAANNNLLLE